MINPAPRASMVSALLRPQEYREAYAHLTTSLDHGASSAIVRNGPYTQLSTLGYELDDDDEELPPLRELPDTSILFRGYVEAGKMVNVYDWYQSFASVMDARRRQQKQLQSPSRTPSRPPKPAKLNGSASVHEDSDVEMEAEDGAAEDDDEENEAWRVEVQARFMRALHELDYTGFIKHTGRKADHIIRTVYDVPD